MICAREVCHCSNENFGSISNYTNLEVAFHEIELIIFHL
jgi:hypothetical protein